MSTCFICFLFSSFLVSSYFFLPRLLFFLPVSPLNFLSSLLFYSAHLSHCFHSHPSRFQELKDIDEDTTEAQAISRLKKAQTCISNGYVYARQWDLTISFFSFCWVHSHFCACFIFICVYFPCSHGMFFWWALPGPTLLNLLFYFLSHLVRPYPLLPHLSLTSSFFFHFLFPLFFLPISLKCMIGEKKQQNAVVGHATKLIANDLKYVRRQPMTYFEFFYHHKIFCII